MFLGNNTIDWSCKLKYLGIWIKSGKHFDIDVTESRSKFFRTANYILHKAKYACDMVKLNLLESHCLPIILYCSESGCINDNMLILLNSCWNSIYRKIFGYFRWESVRNIMCCLNKMNVSYIVNQRRILFVKNLYSNVPKTNFLADIVTTYIHYNEFQTLLHNCNIDVNLFYGSIRDNFLNSFLNTVHL